ncbi:helicase [Colwellia demingiae]|uniref:Helicase n=1 Tax=Colwellia demingiae TaxID=89401 RepID=A0A5C6QIG9_9GAMM|nr:helicase-related protein [Colwellia demingiae]TWX68533.1 helicase [Colwellia demingiae]
MSEELLRVQRKKLIDWTKEQLVGTHIHDGESLFGEKPLDRFFTGFLFPIGGEIVETESSDDYDGDEENTNTQQVKEKKRYLPPSSAGFSFFITGDSIHLRIHHNAVNFSLQNKKDKQNQKFTKEKDHKWLCRTLFDDDGQEIAFYSPTEISDTYLDSKTTFDGLAKIDALWRKYKNGFIVTITLTNTQSLTSSKEQSARDKLDEENALSLFQVKFRCIIQKGNIERYPSQDRILLNEEEKELELRYKDSLIYGVGHGVSVDWGVNSQDKMELWSDFLPSVEVPQVTADTASGDSKVLEFEFLSRCEIDSSVISELNDFIDNYENWIIEQQTKVLLEEKDDQATAQNIVNKMCIAKERMKKSIKLLEQDENAKAAFSIMNQAMLLQMISNDKNSGKFNEDKVYQWRPFQIAFVLMVLESSIDENSEYREEVDLIWFPTGGGKTEAYLGVMAFLFIYRRLIYPASYGGTVAIMRYTLRLLTTQQFLRACKVISALEIIRQKNKDKLGNSPISVGLWLGGASSPNTIYQAKECIEKQDYSKFVLSSCPWCGDKFSHENYKIVAEDFHFTCTNKKCDLGKTDNNVLPYNVVDESLYNNPPSLLIATVDKFARLAWEERTASFFGKNGNRPPELIIQDELHLISSALGSVVGMYEAGIDALFIAKGVHAKYIASTATIKSAAKQVKNLFARDMQLFPPSGLRFDDSYFAKTVSVKEKSGRLYIGYLAPKLSKNSCMEPLAGTLLAAPTTLFNDDSFEQYLDSWWTQIIYHGSLKGVNNSHTVFQGGAKAHLISLTKECLIRELEEESPNWYKNSNHVAPAIRFDNLLVKNKAEIDNVLMQNQVPPELQEIFRKYLPIREITLGSLTSKRTADETAQIFEALSKSKSDEEHLDVALATNMISVGLDVSRLALMIINGQPLTTAEYIQASSRVGRSEIPGIVFVNYYKTQARSLSHYENFRAYHDSFYRFVEPSSLTPFTYQVCSRALHAALIIALRYSDVGLLENNKAGELDPDARDIKKIISIFKGRIKRAIQQKNKATTEEVNKINQVNGHIDSLIDSWYNEIKFNENSTLVYNSKDRGTNNLICNFGEEGGNTIPWGTLQSMRNVENIALTKLIKGVKQKNA